jgi:hypothetical protein
MANLENIVQQLRQERDRLDSAIKALEALTAIEIRPTTGNTRTKGKRTVSLAARRRMAAAQKARWAKAKSAPKPTPRTMSPSARRKIAAAQRARWAKLKRAA